MFDQQQARLASVLVLTLALAACATSDNASMVRGLDEATLQREMRARFYYPAPQPPPKVVSDPRAGQRADAEYFTAFPEFDRSYAPRARAEAKRLADRLVRDAENLSREQFELRVAEIVALADNGHTFTLDLTPRVQAIPARLYPFADGLRILYADDQNADLIGARVDRIEGRTVEGVFSVIGRYQGGATPAWRRRMLLPMLETPALLEAAGIARNHDSLVLSGVRADGAPFERRLVAGPTVRTGLAFAQGQLLFPDYAASLRGLSFRDLPVSLQNGKAAYWSAAFDGGLYVRLTGNADPRIPAFLDGVLSQIRKDQPPFIVFDMRMNPGGDYTRTYKFARALPDAARSAPIYVLTSPWTFSAAITTVAALKDQGGRQVIIVGENVGDRLDFWAEGGTFYLPNTRLALNGATARHVYNGPCEDLETCFWLNYRYPVHVRTLRPDIAAPWTFEAYRAGRDPALDAVRAHEASHSSQRLPLNGARAKAPDPQSEIGS